MDNVVHCAGPSTCTAPPVLPSSTCTAHLYCPPPPVPQEYFDGKELCKSIDPDEAVAYGAAVQVRHVLLLVLVLGGGFVLGG